MGSYATYMQQVQRFLREQKQDFLNPDDLLEYINRARRDIAMKAMCVRRLTTISGSVQTCTVTAGGTGYSASPTVTISAPDFPSGRLPLPNGDQATATAIVTAGVITAISVDYGGAGYFQPVVTITDSTGTGATATASISPINSLVQGQEVYPLSAIDVSQFPGVDVVYMVHSASIIYSNYRYSIPEYSFSVYQAKIRQYPFQYQYVPTFAAQTQQGASGEYYMYPIPSQTYQLEFDCFCLPQDLTAPNSEDVIPKPWDDVVPYFAAHLAYLEIQNFNAAGYYFKQYDTMMQRYSSAARWGRAVNQYGRY
jgi:hypothetical protein